jgi:hypothetical protein
MIVDMPSGVQTKDLADDLDPNDQGIETWPSSGPLFSPQLTLLVG